MKHLDRWGFLLGLLVLLGLSAADAWVKHRTIIGPPERLQVSPSGRVEPLDPARRVDGEPDRMFRDDDAYFWISYTRLLLEQDGWRLARSPLDNTPFGREICWSHAPIWLLGSLAWVVGLFPHGSLDETLAATALWVHPLLFGVLVVGAVVVMARRVPAIVALALASHFLLSPVLGRDMSYGTIDHHAFVLLCVAGTLLCLMNAGGSETRARRWMIASGLSAGAGIWIQAAFVLPLLAGVALGGLAAGWRATRARLHPEHWRAWGLAAAIVSLGFYLVERFPDRLDMRLEVNHPLYAAALAALGELLCRLLRLRAAGRSPARRGDLLAAVLCAAVLMALPAAALLGPESWFSLRDPFLERVHSRITAYQPGSVLFQTAKPVPRVLIEEMGLLALAPLAALFLLLSPGGRRAGPALRASLWLPLAPAVVAAGLFVVHVRNSSLSVLALTCLAFGLAQHAGGRWRDSPRARRTVATLAGLLLAVNGWVWLQSWNAHRPFVGSDRFAPEWIQKMAFRDLAWSMRRQIAPEERTALADDLLAPSLVYFGDFSVTSSLYWENRQGLWDTSRFFAAQDDEEARRIAFERGVRYVVMWATPPALERWRFLRHGTDPEATRPPMLGDRLASASGIPAWLEEVTDQFGPVASRFYVRVFRVRYDGIEPGAEESR